MALIPAHNTLGLGIIPGCERPRRGQPFCQLVERGDVTMFQLENPCPPVSTIINTNYEFDFSVGVGYMQYDPGGKTNWTDGGTAANSTGNSKTLFPVCDPFAIGDEAHLGIYLVLCPGVTAEVIWYSGTVLDATSTIVVLQSISVSGSYDIFHTNEFETGNFGIRLVGTCAEGESSILDQFIVYANSPGSGCFDVLIKNIDGDTVGTATQVGGDGYISVTIDWTALDIPDGCYTVCVDDEDLEGALCSPCLLLKDSHPCSLLLEWWNANDAYGFYYDGTFKHSMRVAGSLAKPAYDGEKEVFKDTEGAKTLLYADKEKRYELAINDIPEYMHDALAIGIDHDNFTIDGTAYIVEESAYEPQWRKTSDLASVILDVKPKTQNLKNSYC